MGFLSRIFGKPELPRRAPTRPAPASSSKPAPLPREMSATEVREALASANPPQLIDVREAKELRKSGWIPGSKHIAMSTFQGRESEIDSSRPVILYCAAGVRSHNVGCHLMDQGFESVGNLTGGFQAWDGDRATGTPQA